MPCVHLMLSVLSEYAETLEKEIIHLKKMHRDLKHTADEALTAAASARAEASSCQQLARERAFELQQVMAKLDESRQTVGTCNDTIASG